MLTKLFLIFFNIIFVLLNNDIQAVLTQDLKKTNDNDNNTDNLEFLKATNNSYFSIKINQNETVRDKRALGIFLQGLVQALGYNTTPIQIATLPNPSTNRPNNNPVNLIDIRSIPGLAPQIPAAPPPNPTTRPTTQRPTTPVLPSRRETLRFTGVVNFGNNSDIVGHLQQYERLFHGSSTPAPATTSRRPSTATNSSSPKPLLQPYFVPIPIPLAENLRYPRPLVTVVTTPSPPPINNLNVGLEGIDIRKIPKQILDNIRKENINNDDVRIVVNKYFPVPCSIEEKAKGHNGGEKDNYAKGEREEVSGEYDDHKATSNDEGSEEEHSYEDKRVEEPEHRPLREEEEEQKKVIQNNDEDAEEEEEDDEEVEAEENEDGVSNADGGEGGEVLDDEMNGREKGSNDDYSKRPYAYENPNNYIPERVPENFVLKLPIDVKPFQGEIMNNYPHVMNSYGQSLEHGGKVDDSVADYFAKYKNPNSGIFDPVSAIASLEGQRRKLISGEIIGGDSLEQNRGFLSPQFRYEEYNLRDDRVGAANTHNYRKGNDNDEKHKNIKDSHEKLQKILQPYEHNENMTFQQQSEELFTNKKISSNKTITEPFDLTNYQPYYQPVQYYYLPELRYGYDLKNTDAVVTTDENKDNSEKKEILIENQYLPYKNPRNIPHETSKNLSKNDSKSTIKLEKKYEAANQNGNSNEKIFEKRPFIPEPFDFVRYQAYYKPVQYYYSPESLERTAQSIVSYVNHDTSKEKNAELKNISNEASESESAEINSASTEKVTIRSTPKRRPERRKNDEIIRSKSVNKNDEKSPTTTTRKPTQLKQRQVNRNKNHSYRYKNNTNNDSRSDKQRNGSYEQPVTEESRDFLRTREISPKSHE